MSATESVKVIKEQETFRLFDGTEVSGDYILGKDGHHLFFRSWKEEGPLKAILYACHGCAEHSGRNNYFFTELNKLGIRVNAIDLRAHGITRRINETSHLEVLPIDDIDQLLEVDSEIMVPRFLLGHSMGGQIVTKYALISAKVQNLAGVIMISPVYAFGDGTPRWKLTLGQFFVPLFPKLYIPHGLDLSNISRVSSVEEDLRSDPDYRKDISLINAEWIMNEGKAITLLTNPEIKCPIFMIIPTADHLVSPIAAEKFYDCLSCSDKSLKKIDGGYHSPHADICKDEVIGEIGKWILEKSNAL